MTWLYNNELFTIDDVGDYNGFIYLITDLRNNKKYIGQKVFWNKVVKKPLKGRVNKRRSRKPSNWTEYYGSSDELNEEVNNTSKDNFKREILRLCNTKAEMNYFETKEIMARDAIISDQYYNSWVSCRITKNQLSRLIETGKIHPS